MPPRRRGSLTIATAGFRGSLGTVSVEEDAMLTGMEMLAAELDSKFNASVFREWRITMNQITKGRGTGDEDDPLSAFLEEK